MSETVGTFSGCCSGYLDFILSVRLFLYTRFFMWIYKASKLLDSQRLKNNWANKSHDN